MTTLCRSNEATKLEKVVGIVKTQLVLICTTTNDSLSSAIWFVQTITFSKEARADPLICCDVCLCNVTQSDPHLRRKNRRPARAPLKPHLSATGQLQGCSPAQQYYATKKRRKAAINLVRVVSAAVIVLLQKQNKKNQQIQFT